MDIYIYEHLSCGEPSCISQLEFCEIGHLGPSIPPKNNCQRSVSMCFYVHALQMISKVDAEKREPYTYRGLENAPLLVEAHLLKET